jgi:Flp pilus assembly protein TadG
MTLLAPVLFLLTIGALELGRGLWVKHMLSHVATEAARYASVRSLVSDEPATAASVAARARSEVMGINPEDVAVETIWNPSNQPGSTVQVRVNYEFRPLTALLPATAIHLRGDSQRIISY